MHRHRRRADQPVGDRGAPTTDSDPWSRRLSPRRADRAVLVGLRQQRRRSPTDSGAPLVTGGLGLRTATGEPRRSRYLTHGAGGRSVLGSPPMPPAGSPRARAADRPTTISRSASACRSRLRRLTAAGPALFRISGCGPDRRRDLAAARRERSGSRPRSTRDRRRPGPGRAPAIRTAAAATSCRTRARTRRAARRRRSPTGSGPTAWNQPTPAAVPRRARSSWLAADLVVTGATANGYGLEAFGMRPAPAAPARHRGVAARRRRIRVAARPAARARRDVLGAAAVRRRRRPPPRHVRRRAAPCSQFHLWGRRRPELSLTADVAAATATLGISHRLLALTSGSSDTRGRW